MGFIRYSGRISNQVPFEELIEKTQGQFLNVPNSLVEEVIRSQFRFVHDTISQGEFQTVVLWKLGKFGVKKFRKQKLDEKRERYQKYLAKKLKDEEDPNYDPPHQQS